MPFLKSLRMRKGQIFLSVDDIPDALPYSILKILLQSLPLTYEKIEAQIG